MKEKYKRHDSLVERIEERFRQNEWKTYLYTEYHNRHGAGEIDLYATKGKYRAVVEVKCNIRNKNWLYAHDQLARAVRCFFKGNKRNFAFVAYYNSYDCDDYTIEWVNPQNPSPLF